VGLAKAFPDQIAGQRWVAQELASFAVGGIPSWGPDVPQFSQSGRTVFLVGVSQGRVYTTNPGSLTWTESTNATGESPPLNFDGILFSTVLNQRLYFADGINWAYYDPSDNTVKAWVANAGLLPVDDENNTPRLICTWRSRLLLSGLIRDPLNVFMSAVGDAHNWDYAPLNPSVTDAVALNLAPQGKTPDPVTCLIPYSDDVLIIGCDHSVYLFRGDPLAGGQKDLVTDAVGMAWGKPYCRDPFGNIWFFSNRTGIYKLTPGSQPERMSGPIEPMVRAVDTGSYGVRMLYDDRFQLIHVFVTPLELAGDTTHFVYELRAGAWWTDTFRNKLHNPLTVASLDGNRDEDRIPLLGCYDGYVRTFDKNAVKDDGYPIDSEVLIGPMLSKDSDDLLLKEMQAILGEDSGDVEWEVYTGRTAEEAFSSDPIHTGTWNSGRNTVPYARAAGHAIYLRIVSTNRWAIEQVRFVMSPRGMVRRRSS
jgi:hypothetical protein